MLRYKLVAVIILLLAVGLICSSTARAAVVANWEFNDKAPGGTTTAGERINDSSANYRDAYVGTGTSGTGTNTPVFVAGNPKFGYTPALRFTAGEDELIFSAGHDFGDGNAVAGTDFNFGANDSFTIEASVRCPSTNAAVGAIIAKIVDINNPQWWWRIEASGIQRFLVDDAVNEPSAIGAADLSDGKWHHIAAVREVGGYKTLYVYVDGVLDWQAVDDNSLGTLANNADIHIGSFRNTTTREFVGDIDFIKVSSGALSPSGFVQPLSLPSNPSPADGEKDVLVSADLSWSAPSGVTVNHYTVHLATDAALNNIVGTFTNVTDTNVNPELLTTTTYYWRVDTNGVDNGVPFEWVGDTWTFVTPDANQNVLADWEFNDRAPGSATVFGQRIIDSSGNRRDLYASTASDPPTYGSGDANYGSSSTLKFTLSNDEAIFEAGRVFGDGNAVAGTSIDFANADSFTFEAAVRIPADTNNAAICAILQKYPSPALYPSIYLRFESATSIRFSVTDTSNVIRTYTLTGLPNCYDGKWHHVAAVRDASAGTLILYLDYSQVGSYVANTYTGSFTDTTAKWYIGTMGANSTREFVGDIDFVKISRGALIANQFVKKGIWPNTPVPANGAILVARNTSLSWASGSGGGLQNIYLYNGNMQLVQSFLNVSGNSVTPSSLLTIGSTYHWKVETASVKGVMWSFDTIPSTASIPVPANNAAGIEPNQVLSWTAGLGALYHRVYVGTDANAVAIATPASPEYEVQLPVETTSFDPDISWNKTYYWRIDENAILPGVVWRFTTYKPVCQLTIADGDFVPDCIIDMKDLGYLVERWLLSQYETP
jgi:hypothetical protein